jgi:two-component system CheB/CheR fusion protein
MIYLQADVQRRLLRLFHFALKDRGMLFLGSSEGIGDATDLFEAVDKPARIYRRIGPTRHDLVDFPVVRARRGPDTAPVPPPPLRLRHRTTDRALKVLADRYAPPSVLVDHALNVTYYQGATERFLRPQAGEPTQSLLALARDGLAPHLRRIVQAARETGKPASERFRAALDDGPVAMTVEAIPVPDAEHAGTLLVSFVEHVADRTLDLVPPLAPSSREEELDAEVAMLRQELAFSAEAAVRAEEDLKAYTEEITSMNEELRASNEELETSKEELQSLNEELQTVNSQLQAKLSELRARTADLQNLLVSNDVATLFLGPDLTLRWFSPKLEELFHVREADLRRPVSHLVRHFADDALEDDCRRVLRLLTPSETSVTTADGSTFVRRIMPYRTIDDRIDGVVVTFLDVTEIENARLYAERVVETVPVPLLVLEKDFRVRSANAAFYTTFSVAPEETIGRLVYDLGNGQWDIPQLRHLLGEVLPDDELFENHEVIHDFERIGRRTMLLSGRRLDHVQLILLAAEDITERKVAEEHQALLVGELAHRVKNTLSVLQAMASQTLRRSRSLEEFGAVFGGRLRAYARSHGQLLAHEWKWQDLREVVQAAVDGHAVDPARIRIDGPAVPVSPRHVLGIGLICHELQTNAIKYGALSNGDGQIEIGWTVDRSRTVAWHWRETGGPAVVPPEHAGFGTVLISGLAEHEFGGTLDLAYAPSGLACSMTFSLPERDDG